MKTPKKPTVALSPKRREALERLAGGALMTTTSQNLHFIEDFHVVPPNFYWLVSRKLIKVLDPSRKSNVTGNGHVISERGLELLQKESALAPGGKG